MLNVNTFGNLDKINNKMDKRKDQEWMLEKSNYYDSLIAKKYGVDFSNRVKLAFIFESVQLQVLKKQVLYNTLSSGITTIEITSESINKILNDEYLSEEYTGGETWNY